jgi:hypothetical protein
VSSNKSTVLQSTDHATVQVIDRRCFAPPAELAQEIELLGVERHQLSTAEGENVGGDPNFPSVVHVGFVVGWFHEFRRIISRLPAIRES